MDAFEQLWKDLLKINKEPQPSDPALSPKEETQLINLKTYMCAIQNLKMTWMSEARSDS